MSYKTTVSLKNTTVEKLEKLKIHPREPIEDVINRLLKEKEEK